MAKDKIKSDFEMLAGSVLSNVMGAKNNIDEMLADKMQVILQKFDLVTREEYEILQAMLTKITLEQENINNKIDKLANLINEDADAKK